MGYSPIPTFKTMPASAASPSAAVTKTDRRSKRNENGALLPLTVALRLHAFLLAPIIA